MTSPPNKSVYSYCDYYKRPAHIRDGLCSECGERILDAPNKLKRQIIIKLSEVKGNIVNTTDIPTMNILESLFGKDADDILALFLSLDSLKDETEAYHPKSQSRQMAMGANALRAQIKNEVLGGRNE